MMRPEGALLRLCESWRDRLSNSSKADQLSYAEQFLDLLGWRDATQLDAKDGSDALPAATYVLRAGGDVSLAAHFVMPGSLDPPGAIVERGLDFCPATRVLVNATRRRNLHYAYVTDLFRAYLYDAQTDELLLYSDTPDAFAKEIAPVLERANVERGALEDIRRHPRSHAARQLGDWRRRWSELFVTKARLDKDAAILALDRLTVLRFLFDHDILKRSDWRLRKRFSDLVAQAFRHEPKGCGKALAGLFHDIWFDWKADLFAPLPPLDEALGMDTLTAGLLRETSLLSRTKFSIGAILESFNYGEATEKALVRLVPENDEERDRYLARQTLETVDQAQVKIDLLEEGYRAIFHWFDRLVETYERLGVEFDADARHAAQARPDMDLFAWGELDANRPGALRDKFQHAVEHGLIIYYATPRQYRTARLMLYLHLIGGYDKSKQRFDRFPRIETTLIERPQFLETDKKFIYHAPRAGADEWDAV